MSVDTFGVDDTLAGPVLGKSCRRAVSSCMVCDPHWFEETLEAGEPTTFC
jgi:hypothetical protein